MNQKKIGKFISNLRKEKGLTQEELAEMLGVSNKSISRWENGTTMMDISFYKPVCEIFDISVNELLSAERLENYKLKYKSEENIINTLNENKNNKKIFKIIISLILFIVILSGFIIYKSIYPKINLYSINLIKQEEIMSFIPIKKFDFDKYDVYFYGIDSIRLCENNDKCYLIEDVIKHNQSSFEDIKKHLESQYKLNNNKRLIFWDGGSTVYKNNNYEILYCNKLDGNKDIYFGINGMIESKLCNCGGYDGKKLKYFTRTYHIINIKELADDYISVTLKDYKGVIKTIKMFNGYDLAPSKTYEFKFLTYEIFTDTFDNIFKYSQIRDVKKIDKEENEQINEKIVYNDGLNYDQIENIKMKIKEGSLNRNGVTVIITDNSGLKNIYDKYFKLEKMVRDNYKEMKVIHNILFTDMAYYINENNTIEFKIDWSHIYGTLKDGKYRLTKEVNNDYHIAVEFEIKDH